MSSAFVLLRSWILTRDIKDGIHSFIVQADHTPSILKNKEVPPTILTIATVVHSFLPHLTRLGYEPICRKPCTVRISDISLLGDRESEELIAAKHNVLE